MYYSDDPVHDYERYSRACDRAYRKELEEEILQLENDLEDDNKFFEWFKDYGCENEVVYKLYEKYINDQIEEKREELRDL